MIYLTMNLTKLKFRIMEFFKTLKFTDNVNFNLLQNMIQLLMNFRVTDNFKIKIKKDKNFKVMI